MHALRTSSRLTRLLLAAFVWAQLFLAAGPWLHGKSLTVLCSVDGMKVLFVNDDGSPASDQPGHSLDCPLCLAPMAPPAHASLAAPVLQPFTPPSPLVGQAPSLARTGIPPPPRGPPSPLLS
ncbi:MAG: DUF2946 domain-containing protein [Lautropia sp.]|nr:DUF2946 domain-containing protein [Lautropia sp.]